MCGDEGKRSVKGRMNQTINRYYIYQGAHSEFLCITQADSNPPPPPHPPQPTPHRCYPGLQTQTKILIRLINAQHGHLSLHSADIFLYKPWKPKGFFLAGSLRIIWIPMLWVYGHYKYSNSYSAGSLHVRIWLYRRQARTSKHDIELFLI